MYCIGVTNQGISSHCNASALPYHRGKALLQRMVLHRLSVSAGCLHRKSCCSFPKRSTRASVHQLKTENMPWTLGLWLSDSFTFYVDSDYVNLVSLFSFFLTGAVFQEAVGWLFPASMALRASVGWAVALPDSLHGAVGARGGACAPYRPFIPGSIH